MKQGDFIEWIPELGELIMRANYETIECKFCGSAEIVRNGTRRGTQYWLCKNCGRGFTANKALPKMRYSIDDIGSAIYQYYIGSSLNEIRGHIEQQRDIRPSDSAIYDWVTRFSKIAVDKAKTFQPQVGEQWVADETVLKIAGKKYWLIDIIDTDTRFLLATKLSHNRNRYDIKELMELARDRAGKTPKEVLTDGWLGYLDGIELAYGADAKHIQTTPFGSKEDSTTLIERWHGTLKDRTKVMRGMKSLDTARAILDGWLVYYNFFRPHESLNDKTPAEVAKIKFPYQNWLDVVKSQSPLGQVKQKLNIPIREEITAIYEPRPYRKRIKPKKRLRRFRSRDQTTLGGIRL
jgi:transposase-like protein